MAPEGNQEILHGAINPIINGGTFAVVGRDMHFHSRNSKHYAMNILIANVAQGAFHNAAERGDPPRCLPGTRTTIREEIMAWIRSPKAHRTFILWLYGPAGAGKTAIAQTIAEECEKKGFLAASFFFSRMAAGRNDASRFVATLAYQLSLSIPQIRDPILAAIEKDPIIFSRTLSVQMRTLVAAPLAASTKAIHLGPQVVVVDGIDESGPNGKAQAELLKVVGAAISELREIPITFLIGSRPEYDIRLAFNTKALGSLVKVLVLDDKYNPDADIRCYFESQFREIRERQFALGIPLTSPWPKEHEVERLVQKSSGQFIFASTVIKFVDSLRDPAKGLDIVLGLSDPGKETPFAQLDALYSFILSSVEDLPKVLEVLTLLMLADNYSDQLRVGTVDELLCCEVRRVLVDMHALVFVPPPTGPEAVLRIHHASLYDFLTDRSRSQEFFVDAKQGHIMIGQCWLRMIANCFRSKHSQECRLSFRVEAFVHSCKQLPSGELADYLASFDLKALLEEIRDAEDLYGPKWDGFMTMCEKQQANHARVEFFPRLQKEFHDFITKRVLQYPPSVRACIPLLFDLISDFIDGFPNISLVLLHGACRSKGEFARLQELDGGSLNIRNLRFNNYFATYFESKQKHAQDNMNQSYVKVIEQIVRIIHPMPGEAKSHIKIPLPLEIDFPTRKSMHLSFSSSFEKLLSGVPGNVDLARFLQERALQYGKSKIFDRSRRLTALSSLKYIQECNLPYLKHRHPPDTDICIICEKCPDASVDGVSLY